MARPKAPGGGPFLLDTAAILEPLNLPAASCWTTPGVLAEVQSGGATGRRAAFLQEAGLHVEEAAAASVRTVRQVAAAAGSAGRLSETDVGILALALERGGTLLTDDYTVQETAARLGIPWRSVVTRGIRDVGTWSARCSGCGRTYGAERGGSECPVCGAEIKRKRQAGPR